MDTEPTSMPDERSQEQPRWLIPAACLLLVAAAVGVYANSLSGVLFFDDLEGLVENPHIRQLWPLGKHFQSPQDTPTQGRPLVSLSFALNYAFGELDPTGYHAVNIAIHALAALALFGVVRRTLAGESLRERFGRSALPVAFVAALLWAVHPLNSECMNYVSQRTESMMGLFFLLTLYCAIRAGSSRRSGLWQVAAVVSCALGALCKEVIVVAPLLILLYDWAFRSKPCKVVLAGRWRMYLGLAGSWGIVAALMAMYPRSATVGVAASGGRVTSLAYLANQCPIIIDYLRHTFWPHPLVIDYGRPIPDPAFDPGLIASALALIALLVGTLLALRRRPKLGFLGAWFFIILAPTSSIVPIITEAGAERRMYLPLAAIVVLTVVVSYLLLSRILVSRKLAAWAGGVLALLLAAPLGLTTLHRNTDYRSWLSIWLTGVAATPTNPRAHTSLSHALRKYGRFDEAIVHSRKALELRPTQMFAHQSWAASLLAQGQLDEALAHYSQEIKVNPAYHKSYNNAAWILATRADATAAGAARAVSLAQRAAELTDSADPSVLDTLAAAYASAGRFDQAVATAREAIRLASQAGREKLAAKIAKRLALYEQNRPYRAPRRRR